MKEMAHLTMKAQQPETRKPDNGALLIQDIIGTHPLGLEKDVGIEEGLHFFFFFFGDTRARTSFRLVP